MHIPEEVETGAQAAVNAAAEDVTEVLEAAAAETVGVETVVHGVTKPFMTDALRQAWARRRVAYRVGWHTRRQAASLNAYYTNARPSPSVRGVRRARIIGGVRKTSVSTYTTHSGTLEPHIAPSMLSSRLLIGRQYRGCATQTMMPTA